MSKRASKEKPQVFGEVKNVHFSQQSKDKRSAAKGTDSKKSSQASKQQINTSGKTDQEVQDRRKTNVTIISQGARPGMRNMQGAAKPKYVSAIQDAIELTHNKVSTAQTELTEELLVESERQECFQR